jgi:hypothetical protein
MGMALVALGVILATTGNAAAQLTLTNGGFDADPDLGSVDDPINAPTGWFVHYTEDQTWSDFRFGNNGNGSWTNNGVAMGQNFTGPNFDPGPEDGYYYTRLGAYGGEISAKVQGFGYNRTNSNPAGNFDVSLISTPAGAFTPADGADPAAAPGAAVLGSLLVDISSLTGSTAKSQAFTLDVPFAGTSVARGQDVWLRIGDGPEDGDLNSFDEPIIDNLTLTTLVPEPSGAVALLLAGCLVALRSRAARRRAA